MFLPKKFRNFIYKLKRAKLTQKKSQLEKDIKKQFLNSSETAKFSNVKTKTLKQVDKNAMDFIIQNDKDPEKILAAIEKSGIKVYRSIKAETILDKINECEGFISEVHGLRALYLNIMLTIFAGELPNISFSTKPMFFLTSKRPDVFLLALHVHKMCGWKLGLPGYDYESQRLFKKFFKRPNSKEIKDLSIKQTLAVKLANARDEESTTFALMLLAGKA